MPLQLLSRTRLKILQLLRRSARTVNELAATLHLTDNGVRAQLTRLERDGLVRQAAARPAFRKPEFVYETTPNAERLFAKAYAPALGALLKVLETREAEDASESWLREMGRQLAAPHRAAFATLPPAQRTERTLQLLGELGAIVELRPQGKKPTCIQGHACPLAEVVSNHPRACIAVEAMVSELLGRPVRQQCEHSPKPKCRFALT